MAHGKDTALTQKGQVTIPAEIRRALGLQPRDRVHFELDAERGIATVQRAPSVADLLFGAVPSGEPLPRGREFHELVERLVADEVVNETQ